LVIRFIEHLYTQLVTISNYRAIANSHLQFTKAQTELFASLLVTAYSGGRSTSCGFPNYPRASATKFQQQQLTRTELQQFSGTVTHQPTHFAPLTNCQAGGNLTSSPIPPIAVSRLYSNGSGPSLCSLGADRTENTASTSSSIVACMSLSAIT
jgi:hypothetical protein